MNIILNGASHAIGEGASVADLLASLGLAGQRLAVEVNGAIIPRGEHATHVLHEGDRVEIVRAIGGG